MLHGGRHIGQFENDNNGRKIKQFDNQAKALWCIVGRFVVQNVSINQTSLKQRNRLSGPEINFSALTAVFHLTYGIRVMIPSLLMWSSSYFWVMHSRSGPCNITSNTIKICQTLNQTFGINFVFFFNHTRQFRKARVVFTYVHCMLGMIIYQFVLSRKFVTIIPYLFWTILLTILYAYMQSFTCS